MPLFRYAAKNPHGDTVQGKVEAKSKHSAVFLLQERGLLVIKLNPIDETGFALLEQQLSGVKFNDVVNITQQLATMISAGLTLK